MTTSSTKIEHWIPPVHAYLSSNSSLTSTTLPVDDASLAGSWCRDSPRTRLLEKTRGYWFRTTMCCFGSLVHLLRSSLMRERERERETLGFKLVFRSCRFSRHLANPCRCSYLASPGSPPLHPLSWTPSLARFRKCPHWGVAAKTYTCQPWCQPPPATA